MPSAATTHPPLPQIARPSVSRDGPIARPRPGPGLLLAGFGLVPLGVAASIAFLAPAAALVTAFSLVVIAACAIALLALDMAADTGAA